MEFIGRDGWAAPRLKDAALSLDKLRECYLELIIQMRVLYQKCKLVHGDLSEYNILYFEGHLYIIDVSQSVDLDHPLALNFLREDCDHVSDFFKKHGVAVMTIRELFDFIVDPAITDENVDSYLEEVQRKVIERGEISVEDEIADSVFMKSYIPKSLDAVNNPEADVAKITSGQDTGDMLYQTITGLKDALPKIEEQKIEVNDEEKEEEGEEEEDGESEEGSEEEESEEELGHEDKKAARKEHKKKVKEEKRESRKTKTPKSVKKRKKKVSKPHKTR
jgi:RIO kinase 1